MKNIEDLEFDFTEKLHKKIGINVKRIRKLKKVSQLKLAYALGYKSVSQISSAEIYYNKIHFNIEQLVKIAYVLNVPISNFFEGLDI
ncbi:helix-turn-helix domain-containing protein [Arcobacter porcinus]|uniref:helix-turn-helix domain-containing protein n=1 Tax=Arcobacter porcinus TaxID=1935204 RepID=UPI00081F66E5|nr:helix-turn-helix transcriptional regulator [Arcobacter porcinus]OCL84849.1 Helix-turn-helix domain protein [Arcobacter porcinus]